MNSVGPSGDKKSYRLILLLVVGLAAFSSAMKELNQVREFTREARSLVASLSKAVEPAPAVDRVAPVEVPRTAARLEVCENSHPVETAEPLQSVRGGVIVAQEPAEVREAPQTVVTVRSPRREVQVQTLRKLRPVDIDLVQLRNQVRRATDLKVLMADSDDDEAEISAPPEVNVYLPKVEVRQLKTGTKEHDVFLKSLNRSLNVRRAG